MERVWSGNALRSDLIGDTPKELTKSEMWYMQNYVLRKK
jgi:hypothetical protein